MYTLLPLAALAGLASASCLHGTSYLPRRSTGNNTIEVAKFGYTGTTGPVLWDSLSADNVACSAGRFQSPINIADSSIATAPNPTSYTLPTGPLTFENLGSTVEVLSEASGNTSALTFDGKAYSLKQFHFHTPAEHRVSDEHYPLEMHMVHEAPSDGSLVVVALLFDLSTTAATPLVKALAAALPAIANPGTATPLGEAADMADIAKHITSTPLRAYAGSLTTPPCKEGVTFLLATEPLPLDVESYNAFKRVVKFNARFSQGALGEENLLRVFAKENEGRQRAAANETPASGAEEAPATSAPPALPEGQGEGDAATVPVGGGPGPVTEGAVSTLDGPRATPAARVRRGRWAGRE
ncbi:carbonic anhydrase [Trichodelitschia bisporula]|uniref:carbonic anhydrase n=1 Tax=Trichodelitschia bisporula TaxID=703511 RepID=A0A6G1I3Q9_9PEZI|nr:carbonic anhydrase [Trichodelitschia bisporula]